MILKKKYFDKENIPNTFVGHPLLEQESKNKIDLSNIISKEKKIISLGKEEVTKRLTNKKLV